MLSIDTYRKNIKMVYDIMTDEEKEKMYSFIKDKNERDLAKKEPVNPELFSNYFQDNDKAIKFFADMFKKWMARTTIPEERRYNAFYVSQEKRYELIDNVEKFPVWTEAIVVNKKWNIVTWGFIVNNKLEDFKITFNIKKFSDVFKKRTKNITPMDKITNLHFK